MFNFAFSKNRNYFAISYEIIEWIYLHVKIWKTISAKLIPQKRHYHETSTVFVFHSCPENCLKIRFFSSKIAKLFTKIRIFAKIWFSKNANTSKLKVHEKNYTKIHILRHVAVLHDHFSLVFSTENQRWRGCHI